MVHLAQQRSTTIERTTRTDERLSQNRDQPRVALIPAYNEQRFIGSMVLATRAYVDIVVVVDDGSSDRTAEIAAEAGAMVVQHQVNQGKAAAINTGFTHIRQLEPAAVVMLDGDGQHAAGDIPRVLAPILGGDADVVVGSRFLEIKSDIPGYRQVGQHGLTLVTNLASGVAVSDSQSGFRAFSSRALECLHFSQGGFSIESEMQFLMSEHQLRVLEAPISVVYAERAKRNPVRHGLQVLHGILKLVGQARPLLYFGLVGVACFLLGGLLGLYMIDIYARKAELAVGYGLLTVLLCVMGMVMVFAGIILHSMRGMMIDIRRSLTSHIGEPCVASSVVFRADRRDTERGLHNAL